MTALRPERGDSTGTGPQRWEEPGVHPDADDDAGYDGSETVKLRVPSGVLPQAPVSPVVGGGRAERRRAEQRSRRRGGRDTGSARPQQPKAKDSAGIVVVLLLSELFITLGVVLVLFVAYQLWWTNVAADNYANGSAKNLEQQWQPDGSDGGTAKAHPAYPTSVAVGTKFAIVSIPKLDVKTPIAEGVDEDSILNNGLVGHYTGDLQTAFPWDKTGNFALAGHRNTHGEPFRYINKLVPGDKIVVETEYDYYTYTVTSTLAQTSPTNVSVIEPVPPQSGFTKPGRYITLTTCTPEFTSTYRMAVWGTMTEDLQKSTGKTPAALTQG